MSKSPPTTKERRAWAHAKGRCYRQSDPRYHIYGAKGITMCSQWRNNFGQFLEDMGTAPTPAHTIERKNGKKGYTPGNCVWATRKEQANNVSTNVRVEFGGNEYTLRQLADLVGVVYKSLWHYFKTRGLPLAMAIEKATRIGEEVGKHQRKFVTADIAEGLSNRAKEQWKKGAAAWGR